MTYVDDARHAYGRMVMCHMLADTTDELLAMANRIGIDRKWIQQPGTAYEHFDICRSKRALAVSLGAKEVGRREVVTIIQERKGRTV
jgi:hypothetical protein